MIQPKRFTTQKSLLLPKCNALLNAVVLILLALGVFTVVAVVGYSSGAWFTDDDQIDMHIASGAWPTITPTPPDPQGTSLKAAKTAEGFAQVHDGYIVYGVRGEVCVENEGEYPTEGLEILDTLQFKDNGEKYTDFFETPVDISLMPVLEAGQAYCYPYEIYFEPVSGEDIKYRNSVSVTILNHSGWLPGGNNCGGPDSCPFGVDEKADFALPDENIVPKIYLPTETVSPTDTPTSMPTVPPNVELTPTPLPTSIPDSEPTPTPLPTTPPDIAYTPTDPPPTETPSGLPGTP